MADPSTKYSDVIQEPLSFFNYHEYLIDSYDSFNDNIGTQEHSGSKSSSLPSNQAVSIVINHFPNPYTTKDSALYHTTRIVRIPRTFDTHDKLYLVPQFSMYTPGKEPAAIENNDYGSEAVGIYDGSVFGVTSATALVPVYLSAEELRDVVGTINKLSLEATVPSFASTLENVLDFFSGTLYSRIFGGRSQGTYTKRKIAQLEEYVDRINRDFLQKRHGLLCVISPVKSAFLSLDFQIPKPIGTKDALTEMIATDRTRKQLNET